MYYYKSEIYLLVAEYYVLRGDMLYSGVNDEVYDVDLMSLTVDKADHKRLVAADSRFCGFAGIKSSDILNGKYRLHDFLVPSDRERVIKLICEDNSPYLYFDTVFLDKKGREVLLHCTGQNDKKSTLCNITLADVSKSEKKQRKLVDKAFEMTQLIEMLCAGVCLFKVTSDMDIDVMYLNNAGCRLFGTTKTRYKGVRKIGELVHKDDKSLVFQSIGKAMATDGRINIVFRAKVRGNEYRLCKFDAAIHQYDDDESPIFHGTVTDLTVIDPEAYNYS